MPVPFYVSSAVDTAARSADKPALAINVVNGQPIEPSTINNAVIGGTDPAAASFTTLESSAAASFASLNVIGASALKATTWGAGSTFSYASGIAETHRTALDIITEDEIIDLFSNNVIVESGISRTLALTDSLKYIRLTHASGCQITVPPQGSVAWLDGSEMVFRRGPSAGEITIVAGSGVTVENSAESIDVLPSYNFGLKRVSSNYWDFI